MAGALSNYLEDQLLSHTLRGDTGGTGFTQPATVYMALHDANPTDAGSGSEIFGGSYVRKLISFSAPSSGSAANSNSFTFSNMPTSVVSHVALWDSVSSGNLLFYGPLSSSISFNSGDSATVGVGAITVSLD